MRIISLIPSATEIICALGEEENLVGRSHECDYPKSIQNLPMCTKLKFDVSGSSLDIEKSLNSFLIDSSSIYHIKEELIKKLDDNFGWKPIHPTESIESIMYRAGQASVIDYIKSIEEDEI